MNSADTRRPDAIGRSARLELVFGVRRGRTVLRHGYAEPPLRVGCPLTVGNAAHLILASSAPGVFGGDTFEQHIVLEPGASVHLSSQSALQVHPGISGGSARVRSVYDVGDEAELRCDWDPVIPFAGSRLDQRSTVFVAPSARLLWNEGFMAGREGHGERWQFAVMRQELRVVRGDVLEYLERFRIVPAEDRERGRWVAGDCRYFGTVVALGWPARPERAESLHVRLAGLRGLHGAVDCLGPSALLARLASEWGPAFHEARATLARLASSAEQVITAPTSELDRAW
ncbi:MAG: urease accessory protein UreD [Vicinamibacterales bacterium]